MHVKRRAAAPRILRYVFFHSLALAALVGVAVTLQPHAWRCKALLIH